jgi:RNA-splicing ligase RtcB
MSCSHGAGRSLSRTEAKRRFSVADHIKATEGVGCRKDHDVIDETPAAYKSSDAVMEAQKDLMEIVHTLRRSCASRDDEGYLAAGWRSRTVPNAAQGHRTSQVAGS